MIDLRPVGYVVSLLLISLGAVMLVPMLVDLFADSPDWTTFITSSGVIIAIGGMLFLATRMPEFRLSRSQGFALTVSAWLAVCMAGSLSFMFGSLGLSFTDAAFESVSGFTTTGSTVITGLDDAPPGLLLWRSLTQWIGGIGIVATAMIMLPFLRIGGMQLFHTESSDISEKVAPRTVQVAKTIAGVYVGLTTACAASLMVSGMNAFDAINHAMTALATGGFSTKDASVGYFENPAIDWVLVVFMTAGAIPLVFYARLAMTRRWRAAGDVQVGNFLMVLLFAITAITLWLCATQSFDLLDALRLAAFNVTSVLTDTGFATSDFGLWGPFAVGMFFTFYFVGGCAGSTAGAIKMFRWHILFVAFRRHLIRVLRPHQVIPIKFNNRVVEIGDLAQVAIFVVVYLTTFIALSLLLMAIGLDFLTSTSAIAQAMANAGPGLGSIIGPAGNFAPLPDPAKWIIAAAMIAGRLELITVYVTLMPPPGGFGDRCLGGALP